MALYNGQKFIWTKQPCEIKDGKVSVIYGAPSQEYDVMRYNGNFGEKPLYATFASINENNEEDIHEFCSEFGLLTMRFPGAWDGKSPVLPALLSHEEIQNFLLNDFTEEVRFIKKEIIRMKAVMGIISGYSTNDMEPVLTSLKALIRVKSDLDEWNYDEMSEEELDEEVIDIWSLENNLISALEEASDEINKYLTEISPNLAFDYYNKRLTGGWTINNLIQAMYFMLYVELSGGKILKHCGNETCTRYFPVSIDKVNAKYCSYDCGQAQASREYRRRKKNKRQGKIQ